MLGPVWRDLSVTVCEGSESEGGPRHTMYKKTDLFGARQSVQKPGNHINKGTKVEGKRVVSEIRNGGQNQKVRQIIMTRGPHNTLDEIILGGGATNSKLKRLTT